MRRPKDTCLSFYIYLQSKVQILLSGIIGVRLHMTLPLPCSRFGSVRYARSLDYLKCYLMPPQVLQKAEAEQWRGTTAPYNPLTVHTTVPLILYENEHLDTRLKTLAGSGGKPKFSSSGLGRRGRRAPFELKLPYSNDGLGAKVVAAWRSSVQLPLIEDPWILPATSSNNGPSLEGTERSHFWL